MAKYNLQSLARLVDRGRGAQQSRPDIMQYWSNGSPATLENTTSRRVYLSILPLQARLRVGMVGCAMKSAGPGGGSGRFGIGLYRSQRSTAGDIETNTTLRDNRSTWELIQGTSHVEVATSSTTIQEPIFFEFNRDVTLNPFADLYALGTVWYDATNAVDFMRTGDTGGDDVITGCLECNGFVSTTFSELPATVSYARVQNSHFAPVAAQFCSSAYRGFLDG